ncbi:class I SAM-dependent methyltransferase [Priestia koreensis]|uniref:class I SAM-dependent methyltransferase n=1 Tax=Priestia koreensis TaxID=284581 RepID=UPI0028F72B02|nr:class I SAM-dependent methyltransferase [Priestia koreensis]
MKQSVVSLGCNFAELWQENMKEWDGTISNRMTDDGCEEAFWQSFLEKKKKQGESYINSYAPKIQQELLALLQPDDRVAEIGPGWGNYTFSTAKHVRYLTCIDSSKSVITFLKEEGNRKQLNNMSFIHEKWEGLAPPQPYDVVFGINCYYRVQDIQDALIKMNNTASRLAIAGMTSGPEKPHYLDLHHEKGYEIKFRRRDYIHLQNILYQLGIMANCKIIELPTTAIYDTYEELIKANSSKILTNHYSTKDIEQALTPYVTQNEGKYEYSYTFHAVLLYWKPVKLFEEIVPS